MRQVLIGAAIMALAACGGDDGARDPDFQRHLAKPLPMNKVYTDSLTFEGGVDVSDWKIFHIEQPGIITVTIHFDKTDGSCEVYLRDRYGAQVAREVQSNNPYIELTRRVDKGRMFVWLNAPDKDCSSQYSIEARLDPD